MENSSNQGKEWPTYFYSDHPHAREKGKRIWLGATPALSLTGLREPEP